MKHLLLVAINCLLLYCNTLAQEQTKYPFQNPDLPVETRVNDLVSRLTMQEKVSQLFNESPAIDRLGIPAYNWWNEALHGVARAGKATVFPQAIGLAATFNESLMFDIANVISDEARAKHHHFQKNEVRSIYTGLTFWSPNINIFRDPRWGRGQETYGEDPFLTGRMAVNFIRGLQGNHPRYFKTIATAKHYAVHSGPEATRHTDNFFVDDRDLYQTYLPAFKMAVEEANVQSVMCAYNRFRDKPCCGSDLLLQQILRDDFGFKGYVVTDCGAISDFYQKDKHHVVDRPSQALGWALASGTDLGCEESKAFVEDNIDEALKNGVIKEENIDQALKRLFEARIRLGMFDPQERVPFSNIPIEKVGSPEHLRLARQSSEESLVLLKNDGILPLKAGTKVALIGPNANDIDVLLGNYNGNPIQPVTPLSGLLKRAGSQNVIYAPGTPLVPGYYGNMDIVPSDVLFHRANGKLKPGLQGRYFKSIDRKGTPDLSRTDPNIDFIWTKTPISNKVEETFAVEWTGVLKPKSSGKYQFRFRTLYGVAEIVVDGNVLVDEIVELVGNTEYNLKVTYHVQPFWWGNTVTPDAHLLWVNTSEPFDENALKAANASDVVIFCGGISPRLEGEEMKLDIDGFAHGDRTHIELPAVQRTLLKKLLATGKPVVMINFSGSAIALNWENENLSAIVQAFYPGEATGDALAGLLFGDINPSGRLPITFYKSIEDLPPFNDYKMEGRTHRYFEGDVLFPFGYGLTFSEFKYSDINVRDHLKDSSKVVVSCKVYNTGKLAGKEVVQLYVSDKLASVPVPIQTLAGFQKISLGTGESKTVSFDVSKSQLSIYNETKQQVVEPGEFEISIGGTSPAGFADDKENYVKTVFDYLPSAN